MDTNTETKKRTRSPNKTKDVKLADIDKKINYHETSRESNKVKIKKLEEINRGHEAEIKKLRAKRAEVEKSSDRMTKRQLRVSALDKLERGEIPTDEEIKALK